MTLNHRVEGAGPWLLLLHAGVADLRMWEPQLPQLSRTHTVVRCDLRGFGGSPLAPGAPYGDAQDVLALLDELGATDLSVVGASMGGNVALQLASAAPHLVRRLVLLAPPADLSEPDDRLRALWAEEERLVEAGDLVAATQLNVAAWLGPEADDAARELVRTMQHDALVAQVAAGDVEGHDLEVRLDLLTMPTTVLVGAHDFPFFLETARLLVAGMPAARMVELAWAGHLPSLERPEEATRLIQDALTRG